MCEGSTCEQVYLQQQQKKTLYWLKTCFCKQKSESFVHVFWLNITSLWISFVKGKGQKKLGRQRNRGPLTLTVNIATFCS